jgi:hypothetical protein
MALTSEQNSVVESPIDAKILVTAGPGTGKTHVLIYRLSYLISTCGVGPAEILVLSFSRAAVKEIRDRLSNVEGNAAYVRASTFDSFATRLLVLAEPAGSWQTEGYDERVCHATRLLSTSEEAKAEVSSYGDVIVDEIQDLVGPRADLVKALLHVSSGGFSLFGDPAQGIYNYQLEGDARKVGSAALYDWIRARFATELVEKGLTFNFRVSSENASIALWAGPELNSRDPDYQSIRYRLDTAMVTLPSVGELSLAVPMLRVGCPSTAILCRDNGQAMTISRCLYEAKVSHRLQCRATDRRNPRWIAIALRDLDGNLMGKRQFLALMRERAAPDLPEPEVMWLLLKRIERLRFPNNIDLDMVNERLRTGDVPDELSESLPSNVVVSTVHRAKGLEFDRVLMVQPSSYSEDPVEIAEETRVLYVGLTRAKVENLHLKAPDTTFLRVRDDLDRRWIRGGPKNWMRTGIEVRGDDVHKDDPAGEFILRDRSPILLQDYIRTEIKSGDPVVLTRKDGMIEGEPKIFYAIQHNGMEVGVTNVSFGAIMYRVLKINHQWNINWPVRIEGLHVEYTDTVAGLATVSRRAGLGGCGVWLRVRVHGIGRFVYEGQV